jgi:A/G-specific adenine glycosylase
VSSTTSFARRLIAWQRRHGRHDLPWQQADAYRIWVSEIMLQQTQVGTVIPYYLRFIAAFPDVAALAAADEDDVLAHWSGLGYYARGRNLHRAAKIIVENYCGNFPRQFDEIISLPGIGRSTAAAICSLAWHKPHAILDGNVKRVLARHRGIAGWPGDKQVEAHLWLQAEQLLPQHDIADYTQGLMDLGASICTRSKPVCNACPVCDDCIALTTNRLETFPTPRPQQQIPERHAVFLLLQHGNDILLEKRAPHGIWGGLWCLPQFDDEPAARNWFLQHRLAASEGTRLRTFTHTFTHFKLHITPLSLQLINKPLRAVEPGMLWLEINEALQAAIPQPVRKLLYLAGNQNKSA